MCAVTDGETIAARAVIDDKIRLISKKTHPFWLDCTTRGRTGQEHMKGATNDGPLYDRDPGEEPGVQHEV